MLLGETVERGSEYELREGREKKGQNATARDCFVRTRTEEKIQTSKKGYRWKKEKSGKRRKNSDSSGWSRYSKHTKGWEEARDSPDR